MKRVFATVLAAIVVFLPSGAFTHFNRVERVKESLVHVTFTTENGDNHYCTGFMVANHDVLTVRHCIGEEQTYVDGIKAVVTKSSDEFVLLGTPIIRPALHIRKKSVRLTDEVYAFGFPWTELSAAVLTRHVGILKNGDIGMDGPLVEGMSGGPVMDEDGEVVGIIQASSSTIGIAYGATEITDFLKSR